MPNIVAGQLYNWHKQFAGNVPDGASQGWDTALDADGNVYVVGQFQGTINFGGGTETVIGYQDFFFAKYSATGVMQWIKKIGATVGASKSIVAGNGVSLFASGGQVYLTISGIFTSTNGQIITINFDPYFHQTQHNLTMNDAEGDAFVVRYNVSVGYTLYAKRISSTGSQTIDGGKITTDLAGNVFVVGRIQTGTPPPPAALRKFDVNGNLIWTKTIGPSGSYSNASDVSWRNNAVYVAGFGLENGKSIVWYDNDGNLQGSTGNSNYSYQSIALDLGQGIYVAGSNLVGGVFQGIVEKYTTAGGSPVWGRYFSSGLDGFSIDLGLAGINQNEMVVTGWFKGTVNFNNGQGNAFAVTSSGNGVHDNIFAARYNSATGNCLWVRNNTSSTSSGQSNPISVATNASNFYLLGYVTFRIINADFCGGTANVNANNASNGYIAKYLITNSAVDLTGATIICTSGANVSLTSISAGATVTWNVVPANLFVTSSGTGAIASLQAQPGVKGNATITFTLSGVDNCGLPLPSNLVRTLWVGVPNGGIQGPSDVYPNQNYFYSNSTSPNIDGGFAYQWTIYGGVFNGINYNTVIANWNESGVISLQYENICGIVTTDLDVTVTIEGGCNPCQIVQSYPNPASKYLVVTLGIYGKTESNKPFQVTLQDENQSVFYKGVTSESTINISTVDFPDGMYILNVAYLNKVESKHILIRH